MYISKRYFEVILVTSVLFSFFFCLFSYTSDTSILLCSLFWFCTSRAQHSSAVSLMYTLFYIVFMPYCTSSFPYLFVDLYHPPFLLPALDELYLHSTICSLKTPSAYMLSPLVAVIQPSVFHSSYRCCSSSFVACFLSLLVHFFVVLLLSPNSLSLRSSLDIVLSATTSPSLSFSLAPIVLLYRSVSP